MGLAIAAVLCGTVLVLADDPPCTRHRCKAPMDGDVRTGYPQTISCFAVPANSHGFGGYYVGGGVFHGECRYGNEGTWGWDYLGFHKLVQLNWWHGARSGWHRGLQDRWT